MKHFFKTACFVAGIIALTAAMIGCTGAPGKGRNVTEENETALEEAAVQAVQAFIPEQGSGLPVSTFKEVWGYVLAGYESALTRGLPISDIGYFGAEVDSYGALSAVPRRQNIPSFYTGKVHMVVTCGSRALSHFALAPDSRERSALIADLLAAARNFDGLQIDFENIPPRDGEPFLSFIRELRIGIGDKIFTIALPARTRKLANDVYDYERILPHVDKILVMGYDEHWSGSSPGSVASLQWCRRVAEYSVATIGSGKLVMGLPFYGRAWGDTPTSRALIYSTTERLLNTMDTKAVRRENGIPAFDYDVTVSVKVYYEDEFSQSARMEMYRAMNVNAIGFWRVGQETPKVWNIVRLER